jgi:hypothetical protein
VLFVTWSIYFLCPSAQFVSLFSSNFSKKCAGGHSLTDSQGNGDEDHFKILEFSFYMYIPNLWEPDILVGLVLTKCRYLAIWFQTPCFISCVF